jgi:hypothetical protein
MEAIERIANRLRNEVYALELDGHLLSLPNHKKGWRNFFRKTSMPIKAAVASAMILGGSYGANAAETNNVPPPAPGIHQTVNQGYHTLKHLDHGFKFPKKDFDWYKKILDTNFRKLYPGIENDRLAYNFMVDQLANDAVEYGGSLKKGIFNMTGHSPFFQVNPGNHRCWSVFGCFCC